MVKLCLLLLLLSFKWWLHAVQADFKRHPKTVLAASVAGHVMAYVDLDMNRYVDLIVKTDPSSLDVFLADSDGVSFTRVDAFNITLPSEYRIDNVAVADFDGDVFPDLLISSKYGHDELLTTAFVCWGSPMAFVCDTKNAWSFDDQPFVVDCNLDQISDLFASTGNGRSRSCLAGSASREFKHLSHFLSARSLKLPFFPAMVDLDGDLNPEVLLPVQLEHDKVALARWEVWTVDPKGAGWRLLPESVLPPMMPARIDLFQSPTDGGCVVGAPVFEDFNADGRIDLLVPVCPKVGYCHTLQLYLLINSHWYCQYLNLTHESSGAEWHVANVNSDRLVTVRAGDFNSDGYPDLLVLLEMVNGSRAVFVFENDDATNQQSSPRAFTVLWEPIYRSRSAEDAAFFDLMETGTLDVVILERQNGGAPVSSFVSSVFEYESTFVKVQVNSPRCDEHCEESGRAPAVIWPGSTVAVQFKTLDGGQLRGAQSLLYSSTYRSLLLPYQLFGLGPSLSFIESMSIGIGSRSHSTMSWLHVIPNARLYVIPHPADSPRDWSRRLYVMPGRAVRESVIAFATVFAVVASVVLLLQWRESRQDKEERRLQSHQFYFGSVD